MAVKFYNYIPNLQLSLENREHVERVLIPFITNTYDVPLAEEFLDISDTPSNVTTTAPILPINSIILQNSIIEQYYSDLTDKTSFDIYDRPVLYKSGEEIAADPSRYVILGREFYVQDLTSSSILQELISRVLRTNNFVEPLVQIVSDPAEQQARIAGTLPDIIQSAINGEPVSGDNYVPIAKKSIYQVFDVTTKPRLIADTDLVDQNLFGIEPVFSSVYSIDQILNINDIDPSDYQDVFNEGVDTIYVNNYGLPQTSITKENVFGRFSLFDTYNQTYKLVNLDIIENEFNINTVAWKVETAYKSRKALPYGVSQSVDTDTLSEFKLNGRLLEAGTFVFRVTAEVYVDDADIDKPIYRYELVDRIQVTENTTLVIESNYDLRQPIIVVSSELEEDNGDIR